MKTTKAIIPAIAMFAALVITPVLAQTNAGGDAQAGTSTGGGKRGSHNAGAARAPAGTSDQTGSTTRPGSGISKAQMLPKRRRTQAATDQPPERNTTTPRKHDRPSVMLFVSIVTVRVFVDGDRLHLRESIATGFFLSEFRSDRS